MQPKLKSEIRVRALIRQCDINMMPIAILHRGDLDAGAILLKINFMDGQCVLLSQTRDLEGNLAWLSTFGKGKFLENKVDEYIKREITVDPDLWVIEIEDIKAAYIPVEPII